VTFEHHNSLKRYCKFRPNSKSIHHFGADHRTYPRRDPGDRTQDLAGPGLPLILTRPSTGRTTKEGLDEDFEVGRDRQSRNIRGLDGSSHPISCRVAPARKLPWTGNSGKTAPKSAGIPLRFSGLELSRYREAARGEARQAHFHDQHVTELRKSSRLSSTEEAANRL